MIELTVQEYADLRRISRQAVYDAIGKKTIKHKSVFVRPQVVIELEDEEYQQLILNQKAKEHGENLLTMCDELDALIPDKTYLSHRCKCGEELKGERMCDDCLKDLLYDNPPFETEIL